VAKKVSDKKPILEFFLVLVVVTKNYLSVKGLNKVTVNIASMKLQYQTR